MKMGRSSALVGILALGALVFTAPPAPVKAQDVETRECRCIDRDGNEIENCSCFRALRAPNVSALVGSLTPFGSARPRMGISVDVGQSARNDARGARVTDVLDDGPADDAGIRVGDIITSVDGHSLFDALPEDAEDDFDLDESIPVQRLLAIARDLEPGQEVEVEYMRDDESHTTTLEAEDLDFWGRSFVLGGSNWDADAFSERMEDLSDRMRTWEYRFDDDAAERLELFQDRWREVAPRTFGVGPEGRVSILGDGRGDVVIGGRGSDFFSALSMSRIGGVELMDMKPGLASYFGTEEGVLVTDVDEDSLLGLEAGDVIIGVGDREATSASRVQRILRSYDDDEEITIRILRDGREMTVAGRID